MVWEVKCDNCGEIINWGGSEPSKYDEEGKIPEDAIKFDDKVYCQNCVKKLVQFGVGDVKDRIVHLEERMKEVMKAVGMEKGINPE